MLCEVCKIKEAKIHKMARGVPISEKKIRPKRFCEECFELVTQKIGPGLPIKRPVLDRRKL